MPQPEKVDQAFHSIRLALGWTQTEAAHALGNHQPAVSAFERGVYHIPRLFSMACFAEAAGICPQEAEILRSAYEDLGLGPMTPPEDATRATRKGTVVVRLPDGAIAPRTRQLFEALSGVSAQEMGDMADQDFWDFTQGYFKEIE